MVAGPLAGCPMHGGIEEPRMRKPPMGLAFLPPDLTSDLCFPIAEMTIVFAGVAETSLSPCSRSDVDVWRWQQGVTTM